MTDFRTANRSRSYPLTRRLVSSSIVCAGSSVFLGHGIGSCHCIGSLPHGFLTAKIDALQKLSWRNIAQGGKTWPSSRSLRTSSRAPALACQGGVQAGDGSLAPIDAEIIEIPATTEDDFIRAARDADAVIAKGVRISQHIIDSLASAR